MDHFNATVFNGSMVATRKGFQVTKQKHKGTAFVNSSVQNAEQQKPKQLCSLPFRNTQLTFITNGANDGKLAPPRRRTGRSKSPSDKPLGSGVTKAKRLFKTSSSRRSSSSASSTASVSSEERLIDSGRGTPELLTAPCVQPLSLPAWASYRLPESLPSSKKRLLFMCLAFAPSDEFSYDEARLLEQDPWKLPEMHVWSVQDPTSLHCAITLGALFDGMSAGKRDTPDLLSLSSQLSSIINRRLNDNTQTGLSRDVTIHAVATMAILAGYGGQHDHWHVHMNGLLRLIDLVGGQHNMNPRTIHTIRTADLVGAISAATKPCVPFIRRQIPLQSPSPLIDDERIVTRLTHHLSGCGIQPSIIKTLSEVAIYSRCVSLCGDDRRSLHLEPGVMIEHYHYLEYELLSYPEPLRALDQVISPTTTRRLAINVPSGTPFPRMDPSDTCTKAIESVIRIIALRFLREPTFDLPCGEMIQCQMFRELLEDILAYRCRQTSADPLIDPLLQEDSSDPQRPTLIWICLAVYGQSIRTTLTSANEQEAAVKLVCQKLLRQVLGSEASANPELVSEEDLGVFHLLDLRSHKKPRRDAREVIRHLLGLGS
ncbi:Uu.00g010880.m01.CDS01 [Anthostomella pinea]|uniref:Uu.00g010880.m01.CDS01 n=1 Tax=Anthostomella pinea TaxID=933095 RepID=A0AAI8VXL9_9PEZI|nr:Uu.00g010880.m01.CDS01 [Anthostomella pinea]